MDESNETSNTNDKADGLLKYRGWRVSISSNENNPDLGAFEGILDDANETWVCVRPSTHSNPSFIPWSSIRILDIKKEPAK